VNNAPATVITTQPVAATAILGQAATFTVAATGSSLTYQWYKDGTSVAGATGPVLTIAAAQAGDAGSYAVRVTGAGGSVLSATATLTVNAISRLINLSVRGPASADHPLILGVVVVEGTRNVLLRAVGPGLASYGVAGVLADPHLDVFDFGATLLAGNDNWDVSLRDAIVGVGAFPLAAKDAALVHSFVGGRTVHASGAGSGLVLVEAYDTTTSGATGRLSNLSARGLVGTGDQTLIAGFVIGGSVPKKVLLRAVGPGLSNYGVTGVLADPQLTVFDSAQHVFAQNDNWDVSLISTFASAGAFALIANSKDAALVLTLAPGVYTAQVSGVGDTTGEALVEIYELP
jgi:hypothetical protein